MTVLQVISSEGYYGAESMLVSLGRALSSLGCKSLVGVFRDDRFPHVEVAGEAARQGIGVEIIPCRGRWDWSAARQIRALIQKHRVDVLHPHGYKANFYAFAAAWRASTALVATVHNWPSKLLSMRAYAAADRLLLRAFDRVATPSDVVADTLRRSGVSPSSIVTIQNGVDLLRYENATPTLKTEIRPGGPLVGFVGRLVPDKGGEVLLQSAAKVIAACPAASFVFVGDGPCRTEWANLAERLGIAQQVIFAGKREDMPGVYASLDLVVLPSLNEAMPMCLLEAMAAGRPVIATRVGSVPRVVLNGSTGLLVEPGEAAGLTAAMVQLLEDPALARRLGAEGRKHVRENFSAESSARRYLAEYQKTLAKRMNGRQPQAA